MATANQVRLQARRVQAARKKQIADRAKPKKISGPTMRKLRIRG